MSDTKREQYKVRSIVFGDPMTAFDGHADAVVVNNHGEWLAEIDYISTGPDTHEVIAMPFTDPDGDFVPAPDGWRDRILFKV